MFEPRVSYEAGPEFGRLHITVGEELRGGFVHQWFRVERSRMFVPPSFQHLVGIVALGFHRCTDEIDTDPVHIQVDLGRNTHANKTFEKLLVVVCPESCPAIKCVADTLGSRLSALSEFRMRENPKFVFLNGMQHHIPD